MIPSQRAFTLIELIVVFSTIAFLSIVGIASYVTYSQSQSLQAATQDMVTTIQLAKSRANSQVKPTVCVGQLDGYSVEISILNKKYTLNAVCGGNSFPLQTTTLPSNITFDNDKTTTTKVFFAVISGGVSGGGTIGITGYGKTRLITVDSVGLIAQRPGTTPTPTQIPTPTPTPLPSKYVFVTGAFNGDLKTAGGGVDGLDGGDKICKTLADVPGSLVQGRTWKAWLSTDTEDAKNRVGNFLYKRVDDVVIANSKAELIDGTLDAPIKIDREGREFNGNVWTGTGSNGTVVSGNTCNGWSTAASSVFGARGWSFATTGGDWTNISDLGPTRCSSSLLLYCFEQ